MKSCDVIQPVHTFQAHQEGTTSVAFSPDGTVLASGGYDCRICLWDVGTWTQQHVLRGHRRGHVAFSLDGRTLMGAGLHRDAVVFDALSWQERQSLENTSTAWGITFTPNGSQLAIIQPETPMQMWDTQTWQLVEEIETGHEYIYALAFAPDDVRLALAIWEHGHVCVLDRGLTQEIAAFAAHSSVTWGMAFSRDGTLLATVGADNKMRFWNTVDWHLENKNDHSAPLLCVAFSPDGHWVATGSLDGTITLCSIGRYGQRSQPCRMH